MICPICKGKSRSCGLCNGSGSVTPICNFCGKSDCDCLERLNRWKRVGPIENIDFTVCDPIEMIQILKSFKKPGLEPLIHWIARGYASFKANDAARIAIADGEREAERLIKG